MVLVRLSFSIRFRYVMWVSSLSLYNQVSCNLGLEEMEAIFRVQFVILAFACPEASSVVVGEKNSRMFAPDQYRVAIELDYLLSERINCHSGYFEDKNNDGKVSQRHLEALGKIQYFLLLKSTGVTGKSVTKCCYAERKSSNCINDYATDYPF